MPIGGVYASGIPIPARALVCIVCQGWVHLQPLLIATIIKD
jgi:hypothetical protein